jgi:two-component system alkaline phosphatase synthesis response regulator PhoP
LSEIRVNRVLVVEDDPTMAEMVAYNLRRQGIEVETTPDGPAGLRLGRDKQVALVVVDLMLPGIDGIQIATELRTHRPDLPILMLTARSEEDIKLRGFAAGVDDYLTKPFSMDELVARVKALLRRSRVEALRQVAPDEITFGDLRVNARDFLCWIKDEELGLRPKELSLLATLAAEPGRLFSRIELAELVWGYTYLGDTRTIDTHVKNVRRKVEERSDYTYIETVRGVGYRFRVRPKEAV